jgi:[ribosomal protein S18]-alanine N-acetyltransferase
MDFPKHLHPIITPMTVADLPAVMVLEQRCFPSPWALDTYRRELGNRYASYWIGRPGWTLPSAPSVLAYGGFWLLGDEAHITTIATHPGWRRRGIGEWFLLQLLRAARLQGALQVTLEVRQHNQPAIALYTKSGFVPVGIRKGYYGDTGEDALLYTLFKLDQEETWAPLAARLAEFGR